MHFASHVPAASHVSVVAVSVSLHSASALQISSTHVSSQHSCPSKQSLSVSHPISHSAWHVPPLVQTCPALQSLFCVQTRSMQDSLQQICPGQSPSTVHCVKSVTIICESPAMDCSALMLSNMYTPDQFAVPAAVEVRI